MELNFDTEDSKSQKQWNINDFVNNNNTPQNSANTPLMYSGVVPNQSSSKPMDVNSAKRKVELDVVLKEISSSYKRYASEYDKIYLEYDKERKEVEKRIEAVTGNCALEDEVGLRNLKVQLTAGKLKALEARNKFAMSKFDELRKEKKNYYDILKIINGGGNADTTPIAPMSNSNSPLSTAFALSSMGNNLDVMKTNGLFINPTNTAPQNTTFDSGIKVIPFTHIPDDVQQGGAKIEDVNSTNNTAPQYATNSEQPIDAKRTNMTLSPIGERLKNVIDNVEKVCEEYDKLPIGASYGHSIKAIESKNTPKDEIFFIDSTTGKYWLEAYYKTPTGELNLDSSNKVDSYNYIGLFHIGAIEVIDKEKRILTTQYDKSNKIHYIILNESNKNNFTVPKFYEDEWSLESNQIYLISADKIAELEY